MKKFRMIFSIIAFLSYSPGIIHAASFDIDPVHSIVMFKVPHLTVNLAGFFREFKGTVLLNDDNSQLVGVDAAVDIRSIYTRNDRRDLDLRGPAIFDAAKFSEATFVSKKIEGGKIIGNLTIKGKTKETVLTYTLAGISPDKEKNLQAAISAKGKINRQDYGIDYNRKLDGGKMLLGDEVELILEIKAILKK